jgi:hypothetical protein
MRVGVRARELNRGLHQLERALHDGFGGQLELSQQRVDVDASMRRRVGLQPAARLLQLAFATDSVAPAGLVPGDRDVNEALEKVALGRLSCAPRVFQFLVGGEELAGANQLQAALERVDTLACDTGLGEVAVFPPVRRRP